MYTEPEGGLAPQDVNNITRGPRFLCYPYNMPLITKISLQKRAKRYNIDLDGEFAFGVGEVLLAREKLHKGKELTLQEVERLKEAAVEEKLYEKALRYLAVRPRSAREMEVYLKRKASDFRYQISDLKEEKKVLLIENIVLKLKESNYLNDQAFAKWFIEQRVGAKNPKGKKLIQVELRSKGVSQEIIEDVYSAFVETLHEASLQEDKIVIHLAKKQAAKYAELEEQKFKQRLSAYLLRRGFEWEAVKAVVDALSKELYTESA